MWGEAGARSFSQINVESDYRLPPFLTALIFIVQRCSLLVTALIFLG